MISFMQILVFSLVAAVCHVGTSVVAQGSPDPLEVIPADWLDLPDAPFVAKVVGGQAVLVNRGDRPLDSVSTGCVQQDGRAVRVVGELFSSQVFDSTFAPGKHVEGLLRMVNNIDHYIEFYSKSLPNLVKRCPAKSRVAVTAARAADAQR
jgi:hypothetical protein